MRKFVVAGAMLVVLGAAIPSYAEMKLAFVDVQRALNECDAGKKAKGDFQSRMTGVQERLQRQQTEVQSLKDELEKKGMLMSAEQRQSLQDQYESKLKNFERDYKDSRDDLQRRDNDITSRIVHDLAQIIRQVGERDGYTIVMEKGSILWGASNIDVTDQIIRAYNTTHVSIGTLGEPGGGSAVAGASQPGDFGSTAAKRSTISK
jgi:outer membrane protein